VSLRVITDPAGTVWHAWSVTPASFDARTPLTVAPQYASGWLAFEQVAEGPNGPAEKRRLTPVPVEWETASDDTMRALLAAAVPVRRVLHV
jgi:hypothetical protein